MKYFHRTHAAPEGTLGLAAEFFGSRLTPVAEEPRRRTFAGARAPSNSSSNARERNAGRGSFIVESLLGFTGGAQ